MVVTLEGMKDKAISSQPSTGAKSVRIEATRKIADDGILFLKQSKETLKAELLKVAGSENSVIDPIATLKMMDQWEKSARALKRYFYRAYSEWASKEETFYDLRPFKTTFATLNS